MCGGAPIWGHSRAAVQEKARKDRYDERVVDEVTKRWDAFRIEFFYSSPSTSVSQKWLEIERLLGKSPSRQQSARQHFLYLLNRFGNGAKLPESLALKLADLQSQIDEGRREFEHSELRFALEVAKDCGKEQVATEALIKTTLERCKDENLSNFVSANLAQRCLHSAQRYGVRTKLGRGDLLMGRLLGKLVMFNAENHEKDDLTDEWLEAMEECSVNNQNGYSLRERRPREVQPQRCKRLRKSATISSDSGRQAQPKRNLCETPSESSDSGLTESVNDNDSDIEILEEIEVIPKTRRLEPTGNGSRVSIENARNASSDSISLSSRSSSQVEIPEALTTAAISPPVQMSRESSIDILIAPAALPSKSPKPENLQETDAPDHISPEVPIQVQQEIVQIDEHDDIKDVVDQNLVEKMFEVMDDADSFGESYDTVKQIKIDAVSNNKETKQRAIEQIMEMYLKLTRERDAATDTKVKEAKTRGMKILRSLADQFRPQN